MYQPKTLSLKSMNSDGKYLVYGANGIIGNHDSYNHTDYQIAIACRGSNCGIVNITVPYSWINGNAMVVKPKEKFPYKEFIYKYLKHYNSSILVSGSGQPQLTRENLSKYILKVPSENLLKDFEKFATLYRKKLLILEKETQKLTKLRDFLLPLLMNGQATISE